MAKVNPRTKSGPKTNPASAKPGTQDQTGKKEKVKRTEYPGLIGPEDPETKKPTRLKLTQVPEDFDSKLHKPLRKGDFEKEYTYLLMKADELEAKAKKLRDEAALSDKLGSSADRAKAKKLVKMQERMAELQKQLEDAGIDVESLLDEESDD